MAVLTLALGIGANTAIFSGVYGILLRPLPYRDADRLVLVQREQDLQGAHRPIVLPFAADEIGPWLQQSHSFESTALYSIEVAAHSDDSGTELLDSAVVSGSFFVLMGGPIQAGRPLGPTDDLVPSVVVSDRLWQRAFGRSPAAVGRSLVLSSQTYAIVGVASAEFQFPSPQTDVWIPAAFARTQNPRCCGFRVIGRLKPGETIAAAAVEADGLAKSFGAAARTAGNVRATAVGLRDQIAGPVRSALLVLFAAVGLALLVACANVTNLLLARRASTQRETATRWALGATRSRLVAHSIKEIRERARGSLHFGLLPTLSVATLAIVSDLEPADFEQRALADASMLEVDERTAA